MVSVVVILPLVVCRDGMNRSELSPLPWLISEFDRRSILRGDVVRIPNVRCARSGPETDCNGGNAGRLNVRRLGSVFVLSLELGARL